MLTDVFIRRPDPRDRLLAADHPGGRDCDPHAAHRPLPGSGAAVGHRHRLLHRRQRPGGRERGHDAARAGHQRRRGHDLHARPRAPTAASRTITVTFDIGRNPDLAAVDVQNRVNQALGRMPADVRTNGITVTKNTAGFMGGLGFFSKDNRYNAQFISNYLDLLRARRDQARARRGRRDHLRRAQVRHAPVARPGASSRRAASPPATWCGALREQNVQVAAGALGDAPADADQIVQPERARAGPAHRGGRVRGRGRQGRHGRRAGARAATSAASNWAPRPTRRTCASSASRPRAWASSCCPPPTPSTVYDGVMAEMARLEKNFPPGLEWRLAFDNVGGRARVDHRGAEDAGRGDRPGRPRDVPVPPELAQHAHPGASPSRCRSSAPSPSSSSSASRSTR